MKATRKILIVEDDDDTREVLAQTFRHLGIEVVETANGIDALFEYYKALKYRQPFKLILLDCALGSLDGLPALDGFTVGRNIRNVEHRAEAVPRARHFYYTAFDAHVPGDLIKEVEADEYIVKSGDPEVLIEKVLKALDEEILER